MTIHEGSSPCFLECLMPLLEEALKLTGPNTLRATTEGSLSESSIMHLKHMTKLQNRQLRWEFLNKCMHLTDK